MSDRESVRELVEELFVLSRQRPGTRYGRQQMEARLRIFLAEREEGIREALAAVKGEDALAAPKMHPFQAGLLRAITPLSSAS